MEQFQHISIIGAGELGKALGAYLTKQKVRVSLWDIDPLKAPGAQSLDATVAAADCIFFCVPSWGMHNALSAILPSLKNDCPVVSFVKGIEPKTHMTMAEFIPHMLPEHSFAVVGGPMIAEHIAAEKATIALVATSDGDLAKKLKVLLSSPYVRVELSKDVLGISLASVLKNIYALAIGIADGLDLGDNAKGWLVARAVAEMNHIALIGHIESDTIFGTGGLGDFIATGFSTHSRNHEVGELMTKNNECDLSSEGAASLSLLVDRLHGNILLFPVLSFVKRVVIAGEPARESFEDLFAT